MNTSSWRLRTLLLGVALVWFPVWTPAATTTVQVELGDSFTGNIAAGVDTVDAYVNVVQNTRVKIAARATDGSDLQPTIALRDGANAPLSVGSTLRIEWLPIPHVVHFFTAPVSGVYIVEIGGSSGSGGFTASIAGTTPSGVETTTISGTVSNAFTGAGIPGATVSVGPYLLITDASGQYSGRFPVGDYPIMVVAPDYVTATDTVQLVSGSGTTLDVPLSLTTPVEITATVSGDEAPGGTVTVALDVAARDGSTVQSYAWTQEHGVPAIIVGADTATPTVTLGSQTAYKDELILRLDEPPVTADQLPPNVPLPPGEFPGGLQDRFQVVGINPFALEEAGLVALEVEVTTTSGVHHAEVEIHTALPWKRATGLRNVPIGVPVLLHGKDQAGYDWALTPPATSAAGLSDAATQDPFFTPDIPGLYEVQVTDQAAASTVTLEVYAGTWRGVVVDQNLAGRPVGDSACTLCHSTFAPDAFSPWMQTGHAEIFTNNLNTSPYYRSSCFPCHTVGFEPGVDNGGADDAADYQAFLDAGLLTNPGDNWTTVLEDYPELARRANIQCENCHGPQEADTGIDNEAHGWNGPSGEPRVDLSSDVCAVCHGEPLRHARFQQWQLSAHANYELAIDRGDSGSCSRCHTANGFLQWVDILLDDDPATDPLDSISVDWPIEETHPQTCVTCHDPHNIGTTSGNDPNVNIRVSGDTPPLIAGFTATDVGRGAMCMTCHNSRRGLRNDATFDDFYGTSEAARAPHGSAQADVLMGQNAYLVEVGDRGSHSFLEDTCVECHMSQTPPPSVLAYNQGGANHTFFASREICADCHENLNADSVQRGVHRLLDTVQELVEEALFALIDELTTTGYTVDLNGDAQITDASQIQEIVFGETRGRQSITVTFTAGPTFGPYRMNDVDVLNGPTIIGQLYDFADPALIKAGWNWGLFHNDGSYGVHNPGFAFSGLVAARDVLSATLPAAILQEHDVEGPLTQPRSRSRTKWRLER